MWKSRCHDNAKSQIDAWRWTELSVTAKSLRWGGCVGWVWGDHSSPPRASRSDASHILPGEWTPVSDNMRSSAWSRPFGWGQMAGGGGGCGGVDRFPPGWGASWLLSPGLWGAEATCHLPPLSHLETHTGSPWVQIPPSASLLSPGSLGQEWIFSEVPSSCKSSHGPLAALGRQGPVWCDPSLPQPALDTGSPRGPDGHSRTPSSVPQTCTHPRAGDRASLSLKTLDRTRVRPVTAGK